jgi:hypothetical protein
LRGFSLKMGSHAVGYHGDLREGHAVRLVQILPGEFTHRSQVAGLASYAREEIPEIAPRKPGYILGLMLKIQVVYHWQGRDGALQRGKTIGRYQ